MYFRKDVEAVQWLDNEGEGQDGKVKRRNKYLQ